MKIGGSWCCSENLTKSKTISYSNKSKQQQCQDKLKREEESSLEELTNKEESFPTLVMEATETPVSLVQAHGEQVILEAGEPLLSITLGEDMAMEEASSEDSFMDIKHMYSYRNKR